MTHWFWLCAKLNRTHLFLGFYPPTVVSRLSVGSDSLASWRGSYWKVSEISSKMLFKKGTFCRLQCRKLSSNFKFTIKNVCHSHCEYIDGRSNYAHTGSLWWNWGGKRRRTSLHISSSTQSSSLQHCLVLCSLKQSRFVCLSFNPLGFVISPHLLLHMPQNRWCT